MRRHILEQVVAGKRLGRHINHDSRSAAYLLPEAASVASVTWARHIPILNQGDLGSCTGNAITGALGSGPLWDALQADDPSAPTLDETFAVGVYSDAEKLDGGAGLPTEDQGSSGISVAKVVLSRKLISGYQHATSVAAAHTAIQAGPFIVGTNWYSSMDSPSSSGVVTVGGSVRGGHEYLCREYDAANDLWWMDNSWDVTWGVQGRFAYSSATLSRLLSEDGDITVPVPLTSPAPSPSFITRKFAPADVDLLNAWAAKRHVGSNKLAAQAWVRGQ